MTGPDRIWAFDYDLQDNDGTWRNWQCWSEDHPKPLNATEYIRRDPAVLAALPEVQALIAAAYEVAAEASMSSGPSYYMTQTDGGFKETHTKLGAFSFRTDTRDAIRALTPAEATAALEAINRAERNKARLDIATEYYFAMTKFIDGTRDERAAAVAAIGREKDKPEDVE